MFTLKLFLGFPADDPFKKELKKANPYLVSLLIGKEEYLQEVVLHEQQYLGKYLSAYPSINQLDDLEKHLLSLLQKLTPGYPFTQNPPKLVTITHGS